VKTIPVCSINLELTVRINGRRGGSDLGDGIFDDGPNSSFWDQKEGVSDLLEEGIGFCIEGETWGKG
jgi:hypothetical protein